MSPTERSEVGGSKVERAETPKSEVRERPPWNIFGALLVVAIALLALYGWSVGSRSFLFLEILLGAAALSVGGFFGFLFGMPRASTEDANPRSSTVATTDKGNDRATSSPAVPYRPSTNLEQVSDWLTKILIGIGLVQLASIGTAMKKFGEIVEASQKPPVLGASIVSQVVVILFLILGFLASFLWTRIYYGAIQSLADFDLLRRLQNVERKAEGTRTAATLLASGDLTTPSPDVTQLRQRADFAPAAPDDLEVAGPLMEKVMEFMQAPVKRDSDPVADLFPAARSEAFGRRLEGEIAADLGNGLIIRLRVRQTAEGPLDSEVLFLLHPTFPERIKRVVPQGGVAEINFYADGWFTAAAITDRGATVLTLDLRRIPGVPRWFQEN